MTLLAPFLYKIIFLLLTLVLCVQLRPAMYHGGVPVGMHCTSCVPPVFLPRSMTTHLLFLPRLSSPSLSLSLSLSLSPFLLLILRSPNCTPTTPLNTKVAIWNVSPQGQVCIGVGAGVCVCVCVCVYVLIYIYIHIYCGSTPMHAHAHRRNAHTPARNTQPHAQTHGS